MAAAVDSFHLLYAEICRSCSGCYETLALLGAVYAVRKAAVLLGECYGLVSVHFIPRMMPRKKLSQQFGGWAVVYGAWEPLARAYAEELARNGVRIILVAQDEAWVREAAAAISRHNGVETVAVAADLSLGPAAGKLVEEAARGRDVGFLVSVVDGTRSPAERGSLEEQPPQLLLELLQRNVVGPAAMLRLLLPGMLRRGRGAVVSITPGGGGGAAVLAACAGFMDHFSRALQREYGGSGVFFQTLLPLQISSSPGHTPSWLVPTPEVYARHAVSTLGVASRTSGYWPHSLQSGLRRKVPDWIWVLGSRFFVSSTTPRA